MSFLCRAVPGASPAVLLGRRAAASSLRSFCAAPSAAANTAAAADAAETPSTRPTPKRLIKFNGAVSTCPRAYAHAP